MQPKGYMPFFEDPKYLSEIDIRGRFMMMACDIEWSMLNIMIYSTDDPHNHHRANKFEGMMMHEKIQNTICDLKRHHPELYDEYKTEMGQLMEFKEVRNDMGHYPLDFDDDTLTSFKMKYIGNDGNTEKTMYKYYTIVQMKDIITKFRNANVRLAELVKKLSDDYNRKSVQHNS